MNRVRPPSGLEPGELVEARPRSEREALRPGHGPRLSGWPPQSQAAVQSIRAEC